METWYIITLDRYVMEQKPTEESCDGACYT